MNSLRMWILKELDLFYFFSWVGGITISHENKLCYEFCDILLHQLIRLRKYLWKVCPSTWVNNVFIDFKRFHTWTVNRAFTVEHQDSYFALFTIFQTSNLLYCWLKCNEKVIPFLSLHWPRPIKSKNIRNWFNLYLYFVRNHKLHPLLFTNLLSR